MKNKRPEVGLLEKHEKFAQAYVIYRNATEAAKVAGYSPTSAHNQGCRLANDPRIKNRIEELEKELETRINVIEEIEQQYVAAKQNNHTNTALKALELLSKVNTKKEEIVPSTILELEADIVKYLEILGEERASKIFLECSWFKGVEQEETEDADIATDDPPSDEEDLEDSGLSPSPPIPSSDSRQ